MSTATDSSEESASTISQSSESSQSNEENTGNVEIDSQEDKSTVKKTAKKTAIKKVAIAKPKKATASKKETTIKKTPAKKTTTNKTDSDKTEYRQLRDTIYTFMYYSNKPMILSELVLQFKNQKKSMVEQILDDLVSKEKIFMKVFGKASKVYCLMQNMEYGIDESIYTDDIDEANIKKYTEIDDKCLRFLRWNYESKLAELGALKEECKGLDGEISLYENELSVEDLKKAIINMKSIVDEDNQDEDEETVTYEEFNKKKKSHLLIKKELARRSGIVKDIADGVSEGLGMKRNEFLMNVGIEEY